MKSMSISANKIIVSATAVLTVAFSLYSVWVPVFLFLVIGLTIGAIMIGFSLSFYAYTFIKRQSRMSSVPSTDLPITSDVVKEFIKVCGRPCRSSNEKDTSSPHPDGTTRCLPVVFGRMVDAVLQQILDLALRDYRGLVGGSEETTFEVCSCGPDTVGCLRGGGPAVIHVAPYVANSAKEELFLRNVSEMVVPAINMLCDPDFINRKIICYIRQRKSIETKKQPVIHADSYEAFLLLIKDCTDLEYLKHIRYTIVTEIIQTNVQCLKAKEITGTQPGGNVREVRRLTHIMNQLTYAKKLCESQLRNMGWQSFPADETGSEVGSFESKQTLPLLSVLESVEGRAQLRNFLQRQCATAPTPEGVGSPVAFLEYWSTAEKLRQAPQHLWHQLAQELYYTYIHPPSSPIKVDKAVKKRMELFLLGDQGPDIFHEVQTDVVQKLQEEYYPLFIASEEYQKMLLAMEEAAASDHAGNSDSGHGSDSNCVITEHNYSRSKLVQLEEKLRTKRQALQALRTSLKPESKVLAQLEREVERLEGECRHLEAHLTRTETWGEHLGRWRASVQSAEFVMVVHVLEDEEDTEAISTGWVVLRKLTDFLELHRKFQLDAEVKKIELPTYSAKFLFGKTVDRSSLDKAKTLIQRYLEFVLEDDRLNKSEALYTFLSPSSDHLKQAAPSPKKNKFSLSTLFKSGSAGSSSGGSIGGAGTGGGEDSEDEELLLLEEEGRVDGSRSGQDGIAEPLYALLGEVFDLRGLFRWLRRSLITFVQITYGRTITRQVRETVAWCFSEPMLHYYAQLFIGSNLVGQQSARRGALKVFEALQESKLNKQLFYNI
ncbi:hypothetical protein B566_EDAN012914 [Ephemera danica]|nr:hypothetical protein B566_EDAN012914 [Ephemera danica]